MGAFEFEPEYENEETLDNIDMNSLADLAARIYADRFDGIITPDENLTMKKLIYLGTSAGGMRPKAVVAYHPQTGEFRSGQVDLPTGFKHYIIKFKEDPLMPTAEIEMVYHEMAKAAGITMMPCFLKNIQGSNHFMTERFDRQDGEKVLTQTLAAIMPSADDYMKLCWVADSLNLPQEDKDQMFIRMVFNYVAGISDDHNKNISFIMHKDGVWRLSPAYDVMFSANTWEAPSAHIHCMGVMGKRSSLSVADFMDFAEDFVFNPKEKIDRVFQAVEMFPTLCNKYGVDQPTIDRIRKVLDSL